MSTEKPDFYKASWPEGQTMKRIALVTGGRRGIGKAIVEELLFVQRCQVIVADIVIDGAEENFADVFKQFSMTPLGQKPIFFEKLDVTNAEACQTLVDKIVKEHGQIDVLVNNAGVTKDGLLMRMSEADWDFVLNINLKGTFNVTKAVVRQMMSQKRGKIINIASVVGISGNPGQANYCASKAGVIGFTKSVAKEVGSRGITVNAVAPGYIETDMTAKLNDAQREAMLTIVPMKRAGKPEDVARVVGFLASQAADYVTGQTITVDGGMVMQ
jgi:3-oxoacyl-[acyl-carrier protein] reductase